MQIARFEMQNLDSPNLRSQDPIWKGPKPNKEMTKTCGPNTTPSQQDKIQTTQCPKIWAQVGCKTRLGRSPNRKPMQTQIGRTALLESILRSSDPRFLIQKTAQRTDTKQGNVKKLSSPNHTKPTGQDSDQQMRNKHGQRCFAKRVLGEIQITKRCKIGSPEQRFWKAYCCHRTQGFASRKPPKGPKSNKEMSKTCGPNTTPSQQDKIQATKSLAQVHPKWPETVKNVNFFFSPSAFPIRNPCTRHRISKKKPDFEMPFASASQGVVFLWFFEENRF
jgi:hypothetical protein